MPAPRPFEFREFGAQAPAGEQSMARAITADELAAARAEGVAEGRRLAMETIAAEEQAQLVRIGDALAGAKARIESEAARHRAEIIAIARLFAEEFATGLAEAREIDAAAALLRRLTENSEDRRAATLVLNARSLERLHTRLEALLNMRCLADFVSLDGDHHLAPGELRLEWRGGSLVRGRAEIKAAVAALFDPLSEHHMEASDERA